MPFILYFSLIFLPKTSRVPYLRLYGCAVFLCYLCTTFAAYLQPVRTADPQAPPPSEARGARRDRCMNQKKNICWNVCFRREIKKNNQQIFPHWVIADCFKACIILNIRRSACRDKGMRHANISKMTD